ncbi:hypothetical protein FGG08_002847 [Glutinoglossum americanum]|uniref:histidine kinase n=1 Tax=Glutinoglossum americanum TaxID=1670608 RepID=A0A9P8L457_9PEZI|nr:hypothetical protein FGG08_002847 [Glutinoglossum americanum]
MEDGNSNVEEYPSPPPRLFERLAQIPGYTWDETHTPLHSSYNNWYIYGVRDAEPDALSTASSSEATKSNSNKDSPRLHSRSSFPHPTSDDGSDASLPLKEGSLRVFASISTRALRLEREYHLCKSISQTSDPDCKHIVKPIDLILLSSHQGDHGLIVVSIFESPGPNYLQELINFGPAWFGPTRLSGHGRSTSQFLGEIPLPLFLDFAIGACECLELLHHGQGIVHGELRGDAFHFNAQTSLVKLVNFGSGARSFEHYLTSKGWSTLSKEVGASNKLQYIAPEMTGRMQADPDSRTDIYSLGVLLWILLTRQWPFEGETPMEIVQSVLARRIPPVCSKRLDIPLCLSQIIQKMTMKQIDERYHSTSGLKRDLLEVQKLLADGNSEGLQNFKVGIRDVSSTFCLPSSMIGRKEEHDKIVRVIEKVSKRHSATSGVANGASNPQKNSLFSIGSNSSVSEGRLDNGDGSSDGASSHGGEAGSRSNTGQAQGSASTANHLGSIPEGNGDSSSGQTSSNNKLSRTRGESADTEGVVDLHRHPSHSRDSLARRRNSQKLRQSGRCEVVSIAGAGGMGKSTLSRSISVEARRHGYFASAKFDQAQKTPFGPVLRLLSSLFKQLFSESEVTTEFHQTVRSYVRPHWAVLHRMLDLPEFLLGQPTGLSKSNSISTHHYSSRKSSVVELKRRESSPSSLRSSIFNANSGSRPASEFLRGGSSTRSLRFMNTFLEVLRLFAQHKFICLCLDDLQFADEESLELISNIVNSKIRLVLIVTYREREILGEKVRLVLESENATITKIKLPPLNEENIVDYVAATLYRPREYAIPLAAVLQEKTQGNPFYMREMLDTCHRKSALWYDWKSSSWMYDLDRVFKEFETPNYAEVLNTDFITKRLQELPSSATSILAWSSLLGTSFSFSLVQKLLSGEFDYYDDGSTQPMSGCGGKLVNLSHEDAVGGLQCALQSYVILATNEDDIFRFAHDRYVQAAASLRECQNIQKMHLIVAQVMMKYYPDEKDIYVRSDHVCQAVPLILKRYSARKEFRDLLFQAAQKASESGARHAAINYYRYCIQLLQPDPWTDGLPDVYYNETLQLFIRAAECYWYQGHLHEALSILQVTFSEAKTPVDKAPSWVLQSRLFAQRRDYFGCVQSLRQCLSTLGLQIREDITWEECDDAFHKLRHRLQTIDRAELLQAPRGDDPVLVAIGAVLVEMVSGCYWSDSLLFYSLALELVSLHLDRGAFVQAGVGYTHLAMIAVTRFSMIQFATEMGEISLYLIDRSHDPHTSGRGGTIYPIFVGHLRDHIRDTIPQLETATENSVMAGDRTLTLISLGATAMTKFYCVEDLEDIESFCAYVTEEAPAWSDDTRGGTIVISVWQTAKALMGKTQILSPLEILSDETHDSQKYIRKISDEEVSSNGDRPLFTYFSFAIAPLYLYGHYDRAIECGSQCIQNLDLLFSLRSTRFLLFYLSLSLLAVLRRDQPTADQQSAIEAIARIRKYKKEIEDWQAVNNINYFMWSELLNAELSEVVGDYGSSLRSYEAALDHAQMHSFLVEEALTNELMGEFCLRRGSRRAARNFIEDSIATYHQIGASGKAGHVSKKHERLLKGFTYFRRADAACQTDFLGDSSNAQFRLDTDENDPQRTLDFGNECSQDRTRAWLSPAQSPDHGKGSSSGLPPSANLDMIDLASILTSSQVISSEVDIDRLLAKMCEIILESTGGQADFAAIIVEDEDTGWSIAAYGDAENGVTSFIPGRPFSDVEDQVSQQTVLYAIRFREVVFLHNLIEDERFSNVPEPWLAKNRAGKSIIALPIIHGGSSLVGVLYLEGQPNSFTDRNLTVLQLLSNQIGISIANALLFKRIRKVSASNVSMIESQKRALAKARDAEAKAKVAEAEAHRNMKLKEEASKAKSMFLANVSHELRTPLNGVIGMSELLKATKMSSEQQEFADSIRVCADTLLTVINDILDFSKLEAGKVRVTLSTFNLEDAIRETIRALAYTHHDTQLDVIEELSLPPGLVVVGDFYRLRQILMNLLSNSYKFTPSGSVTICSTTEWETRDTIQVTTSIADTGIGISQDQLKRLFLPFSQADSSTARRFGGTGLGLSICKSLIENVMGGRIWMKSTEGVGTTVYFTLTFTKGSMETTAGSDEISTRQPDPMAIYSPRATEAISVPSSPSFVDLSRVPRDQIRICIAEDNPINQKIALSFVKKLGFRVDAFENGLEAVEALRIEAKEGRPYHLVLMDVQMPILDGYEATKVIRKDKDPAVRRVLVIAMTASAIRGDREKCLEAGMNNYLAKPVKAATLKDMLEQYLYQPTIPMPNLQQDGQEIAKFAMKDLRRIPSHKPKNRLDTQVTATNANAEALTTDAKQISPKTAIPPRVENGLGTARKSPRRNNSENEPAIISQGWRYGSSSRTLSQLEAPSASDGAAKAADTTLDKKAPPF